ncbi:hypothetical protein BD770DRAFT_443734 [Pilaira anomala]|nr:hypothetical protein BD770DRAFT_443734 [Pilaira anomala]
MPETVKKVVEKKTVEKKVVEKKKPVEKKKSVEIKTPLTTKKVIQKKVVTKKPTTEEPAETIATTTTTATTEDGKPKLTQGQKLLKSMTAQKAAKKALLKGVASTHVSFDDEGNSKVETVIKKIEPAVVTPAKKGKARPAMKKPEAKKRKAEEVDGEDKVEEEKVVEVEKKVIKKPKKAKKSKIEIEESKKDSKQEEALNYVRLFVQDRDTWKFKKVQQIWILSNLYEIPEQEFDNVLEYLKDLQGSAREKTLKEAQEKIPKKEKSNTLTGYAAVPTTTNDEDDFDAEKLLAQATFSAPTQAPEGQEEEEDETAEIKRAKLIINVLG